MRSAHSSGLDLIYIEPLKLAFFALTGILQDVNLGVTSAENILLLFLLYYAFYYYIHV